jgi:predicted DNA-binding protein (MmcQ/YjbR family)
MEDRRLVRLTEICAALPETEREFTGQHAMFRVRNKVFAYFLEDHHGDGIVAVAFKAHTGQNQALIDGDPERFYMPSYVGPRGWAGLRLDTPKIDWNEVAELVSESYRLIAPKRLAARLDEGAAG